MNKSPDDYEPYRAALQAMYDTQNRGAVRFPLDDDDKAIIRAGLAFAKAMPAPIQQPAQCLQNAQKLPARPSL